MVRNMREQIYNILIESAGFVEIDGKKYDPNEIVKNSPEDISVYDARKFIKKLKELWDDGGKLYRIVYAKSKDDVDTGNPGSYWTVYKSAISNTLHGYLNQQYAVTEQVDEMIPFILVGQIDAHRINVEHDIEHFCDYPEEAQVESDEVDVISISAMKQKKVPEKNEDMDSLLTKMYYDEYQYQYSSTCPYCRKLRYGWNGNPVVKCNHCGKNYRVEFNKQT